MEGVSKIFIFGDMGGGGGQEKSDMAMFQGGKNQTIIEPFIVQIRHCIQNSKRIARKWSEVCQKSEGG